MPDTLPPDLKALIRAKVESGQWESEEDVIRAALQALEERDRELETERWIDDNRDHVRTLIQEGIDSGSAGEFILEDFLERARRRWDAKGYTKP